jgi:hypothetical protein
MNQPQNKKEMEHTRIKTTTWLPKTYQPVKLNLLQVCGSPDAKKVQLCNSQGDQIERVFAFWAIFRLLCDFSPFGRFSPFWAIFRLLGDYSPFGRFFVKQNAQIYLGGIFFVKNVQF